MNPVALLAMVLVVSASGVASADVVPPPPDKCPPGAEPATGHGGPYCRPEACAKGCEDGKSCQPKRLCVVKKRMYNRSGERMVDDVVAECSADGTCGTGTCENLEVCTKRSGILPRCGCRVGDSGQARALWVVGAMLAAAAFGRRRRPGRS